jgi:hypothetical protein
MVDIYRQGWTQRCQNLGDMNLRFPIPESFVVHKGGTPNFPAAILLPDGETLAQNQPFHKCEAGLVAYSRYVYPSVNIFGDGIRGAHGGSGMSSIGGAIRLGELVPGGEIKHALKMNLNAKTDLYYRSDESDGKPGYRWPAVKADGYASESKYAGTNPALQMGSLLALPADFDISTLSTEPAKIMARALMNYGAYVVDDTAWDVYAFALEWSPEGRVMTEFRDTWGYNFNVNSTSHPWALDMWKVVSSLHVVDNNDPENIGGGPTSDTINRRTTMAPDFAVASVTGVSVSPATATIATNTNSQLTATVRPFNAGNKNVSWSSSDNTIAVVDNSGLVTGIATGTAQITVTTEEGNMTASAEITVIDPTTGQIEKFTGTPIGSPGSWNDSGNTFDKALDGDLDTFFDAPTADGNWVGLDLGVERIMTEIRYAPRTNWAQRMPGGQFQGANNEDFSEAETFHTITDEPEYGSLIHVSFENVNAYRYVRYLSPPNSFGNIAEVEFWGLEFSDVSVREDLSGSSRMLIYPNPLISSEFTLEIPPQLSYGKIAIYNMLGERVLTQELDEGTSHTIQIGHLTGGIYLVKASNKKMSLSKKILIEK